MNLTFYNLLRTMNLTKLDYKTAIQALEDTETGNDLLEQLNLVAAKLQEEYDDVPVAELSA